jgi:hypothetical protein
VDLFGPFTARCEHQHRSTIKVWGVAFKCTATGALAVHVMSAYSTDAFIMAYLRFAARYGHPVRILPDEGSQLLKACKDMQYSWLDVSRTINAEYGVGFDFQAAPVGGHNQHGLVERSIQEIRRLFSVLFADPKYRLDVLSFESCFAMISNELNNVPICLGSGFKNLAELDVITPNRLILGRNNRRSLSGPCTVDSPSRMLEAAEGVFQAWWHVWHEFRIIDFVAKPPKWFRSSPDLQQGDIVIFQKVHSEIKLGQPIWTIGRVIEAVPSKTDGRVRQVKVEYSNSSEWRGGKPPPRPLRTTNRAARSVARLCHEGEVSLMQDLALAAREAAKLTGDLKTGDREEVVFPAADVRQNLANYFAFSQSFSGECSYQHSLGSVCNVLRIHVDPWL